MLAEFINAGAFAITALWMLLLVNWPALAGAAALIFLAAFGVAGLQKRRGLAFACALALVSLAAGLSAICWLPDGALLGVVPARFRPFFELVLVPAPLILLFVAITLLHRLVRKPLRLR